MWLRIGWAAACFAAIMGFSRLAYGLLVPSMRASIGGGLDAYGAIGAGNFAGYFTGSVVATRLALRADRSRVNAFALLAMCAAMAASGLVHDLVTLAVLRFAVGAFSGVALTLTLALAVRGASPAVRGRAASIIWAGGAAGMALVGLGVTAIPLAGDAWRGAWIAMAAFGAIATLGYARITGGDDGGASAPDDGAPIGLWSPHKYLALALGYCAYGFGYICAFTFFGAALARSHAAPLSVAVVILGGAGSAGALVWGPLVDRYRNGMPVAAASALSAIGVLLLTSSSGAAVLAGAFALGVSFVGVPAMMGALAQQREPAGRYARAFATLVSTVGAGQIVGPAIGGLVAARFGTSAALDLAACTLAFAAFACARYRRPDVRAERESSRAQAAATCVAP